MTVSYVRACDLPYRGPLMMTVRFDEDEAGILDSLFAESIDAEDFLDRLEKWEGTVAWLMDRLPLSRGPRGSY